MGDVVAGVVSFNFEDTVCGQPDVPGVYARVTYFLDWINKNTKDPNPSIPEENPEVPTEEEKPEIQTEEENTGNEVKRRVFTEHNPLLWRTHYQNHHVGLPISYNGFNAFPTVSSSPLWRGYQTFNPVYGQNYWPLRG